MGFAIFERIADAFVKVLFMEDSNYFNYLASGLRVEPKIVAEFERRCSRINWERLQRIGNHVEMASALSGVLGEFGPSGADAPLMMDAFVRGIEKQMKRFGPKGAVVFLQTPFADTLIAKKYIKDGSSVKMDDIFMAAMSQAEADFISSPSDKHHPRDAKPRTNSL